jgi:hypothetical protein
MSPEAYAGFLKLLLTPASQVPRPSAELDAYLGYLADREPLPESVQRFIGRPTVEAA